MIYDPVPRMKCCSQCQRWQPLSEFYRRAANPDGYDRVCKTCRAISKGHTRARRNFPINGQKRCPQCHNVLPYTPDYWPSLGNGKLHSTCRNCAKKRANRNYEKNKEKHRELGKKYRDENPERWHQKNKRYRENHPEKMRDFQRRWQSENPDKVKAYQKKYYDTHKGVRRKPTREQQRQRDQRYYAKHPERVLTKTHKRAALKRKLPATFTITDWQRALNYFDGHCAVCGRPRGLWHTLARDHWIPISKGGAYTSDNIIPLCHARKGAPEGTPCCNNSKSNRDPREWLTEKYGPRKAAQILRRIEAYFEWAKSQD